MTRLALPLQWRLLRAHLRRNARRIGLSIGGVGLGVLSVVAILTLNRSTYHSFADSISTLAGRAQLEISNGDVGVDDALISEVEGVPGVEAAAGVVREFIRVPALDGRTVCLVGVDLLQRSLIWDGLFEREGFDVRRDMDVVAETSSTLLSQKLIDELGLVVGGRLEVMTPTGIRALTLRGGFRDQRFARAFQGDVAVMDILPAQATFGKDGRFDSISVAVATGTDVNAVADRIAELLAGRGEVATPAGRGQRVEDMLKTNGWLLTLSSLFALLVGVFLITHSAHTSATQRMPALAALRTLGATRTQLLTTVLAEAAFVGIIGSALGLIVGAAIGAIATGPFGTFVSATYAQVRGGELSADPGDLLLAAALGIGTTLMGSLVPAIRASRVAPLHIVRGVVTAGSASWTWLVLSIVCLMLGVVGAGLPFLGGSLRSATGYAFACIALMVVGAIGLTPVVVRAVKPALAAIHAASWGRLGPWVTSSLFRSDLRTTLAVGAVAAAFSFATLMSVLTVSYRDAVVSYVETSFPSDMIVNVGPPLSMLAGPVASLRAAADIARVTGVSSVSPARFIEASFRGKPIIVQGLGEDLLERVWPELDHRRADGGVLVSDTFSLRYGIYEGDTFSLASPSGALRLTVADVVADYFLDLGSVKIPWSRFAEKWGETRANMFLVELGEGADPAMVKADIDRDVGARYDLTVLSRQDTRAAVDALIAATFALMSLCGVFALFVAALGVVSAVSASVHERRSELALLRALGLTPGAMRRLVMTEGGTLGLLGGMLGVGVGCLISWRIIGAALRNIAGFNIEIHWPVANLALTIAGAAVAGALAAMAVSRGVGASARTRQT